MRKLKTIILGLLMSVISFAQTPERYEYNTNATHIRDAIGYYEYEGQTFTTNEAYTIYSVKWKLFRDGLPGTITCELKAADGSGLPTGSVLSSGTYNGNNLTESDDGEIVEILMSSYELQASTQYAVYLKAADAWLCTFFNYQGNPYAGGTWLHYTSGSWTIESATSDMYFEVFGYEDENGDEPEPPISSYTDNFESRSTGNLSGQGNWLSSRGNAIVYNASGNNVITPGLSLDEWGVYYNDVIDNDQFSEIKILNISGGVYIGPGVRMSSGGNYYAFYGDSNESYFFKVVGNANYDFSPAIVGDGFSVNDIIRLEAEGNNIRAYKNGNLIYSVTDNSLSSGHAGITGWGSGTGMQADDWEAGNLGEEPEPEPEPGILPVGSYANFIDGVQYLSYINGNLYSKWITPDEPQILNAPIKVYPTNKYYFSYKNKPTIIVTSGEHYGAVLNTDFDYDTYFATLVADGLNGTRISSGANVEYQGWFDIVDNTWAPASGKYLAPWARSSTAGYAGGGNKFDLDTWDQAYFNRLHDFMSKAYSNDIIVEYFMFSQIYTADLWNYNPMKYSNNVNGVGNINYNSGVYNTTGNDLLPYQKALVQKVVTELNQYPNLIWEIANEPYWDNEYQSAIPVAWSDSIVKWITETEAQLTNKHLISQNVGNYSTVVQSPRTGIDIMNFHYADVGSAYTNQRYRELILGSNETGFSQVDSQYRAEAYIALMSGAAYFNNLDYSFTVDDPTGQQAPVGNPAGGNPTLRTQLGIAKSFIEGFDFIKMSPNNAIITDITAGRTAYALVEVGKQYAIYINGGSSVSIQVNLPAGTYDAIWISTKSGDSAGTSNFVHGGGNKTMGAAAYSEDILLKIVNADEQPENLFNILYTFDFENRSVGTYNYSWIPADFNNPSLIWDTPTNYQATITSVSYPENPNSTRAFRFNFRNQGGSNIYQWYPPIGNNTEIYFSYNVRFNPNFEPVINGKIPGIHIGPYWESIGAPPSTSGAAIMINWGIANSLPKLDLYIYHADQYGDYGDSYVLKNQGLSTNYLPVWGQWFNITLRIVLNDPYSYNGVIQIFLDGKLAYSRTDYRLRQIGSVYIDQVFFQSMFGGSGSEFWPIQDDWIEVDDLMIWRYDDNVDVPRGNTEYWGTYDEIDLPNWNAE